MKDIVEEMMIKVIVIYINSNVTLFQYHYDGNPTCYRNRLWAKFLLMFIYEKIISLLELGIEFYYLHNAINIEVCTFFKMHFEPWGIQSWSYLLARSNKNYIWLIESNINCKNKGHYVESYILWTALSDATIGFQK